MPHQQKGEGGLIEDPAVLLVAVLAKNLDAGDSEGLAAVIPLYVDGVEGAASGDVRDVGGDDRSEAHLATPPVGAPLRDGLQGVRRRSILQRLDDARRTVGCSCWDGAAR